MQGMFVRDFLHVINLCGALGNVNESMQMVVLMLGWEAGSLAGTRLSNLTSVQVPGAQVPGWRPEG